MTDKTYKILDFIEKSLIPDVEGMIKGGYQYYVFSVICQAIEVLGSFYDQNDLDKIGESENRFERFLNKFKNDKYRHNKKIFFKALRGNMIHQLRPGKEYFLTSSRHDKFPENKHLTKHDDKTIIIIECFFKDFKKAFELFKKDCKNPGKIHMYKLELDFLKIINIDLRSEVSLGGTSTESAEASASG